MQGATCGKRALAQKLQVAVAVAVVKEAGQSIVAALDNVLRYAWDIKSWLASHATSLERTHQQEKLLLGHSSRQAWTCPPVSESEPDPVPAPDGNFHRYGGGGFSGPSFSKPGEGGELEAAGGIVLTHYF
jgi:hypothetical protein